MACMRTCAILSWKRDWNCLRDRTRQSSNAVHLLPESVPRMPSRLVRAVWSIAALACAAYFSGSSRYVLASACKVRFTCFHFAIFRGFGPKAHLLAACSKTAETVICQHDATNACKNRRTLRLGLQLALELRARPCEAVVDVVGEAVQRAHGRCFLRGVPRRTIVFCEGRDHHLYKEQFKKFQISFFELPAPTCEVCTNGTFW